MPLAGHAENCEVKPKAPLARCNQCPLRNRPVVRGECIDAARLAIVGEAPGAQEVIEGRPFVGTSGRRLDLALDAARVDRGSVYVTNAVLCRPEGHPPTPPPEAISACHARLLHEVSQRRPEKVLALGGIAAEALTGDSRTIEKLRLERPAPSPFLGGDAEVRVTYHPSALHWNRKWPGRFDGDVGWLGEP